MVHLKYDDWIVDDNDKDMAHYNAWHLWAEISENETWHEIKTLRKIILQEHTFTNNYIL